MMLYRPWILRVTRPIPLPAHISKHSMYLVQYADPLKSTSSGHFSVMPWQSHGVSLCLEETAPQINHPQLIGNAMAVPNRSCLGNIFPADRLHLLGRFTLSPRGSSRRASNQSSSSCSDFSRCSGGFKRSWGTRSDLVCKRTIGRVPNPEIGCKWMKHGP